jgi:predicted ATPase
MRAGIDFHADRYLLVQPYFLTLLADVCGKVGQPEAGLKALYEAEGFAEKTGECLREAELHRVKGELLRRQGNTDLMAERPLRQALEVACSQGAKSLELRAVTSLSRLWRDQGKCKEARDLLSPIYGWFTEGFDTGDLQEAKVLLDELA